MEGVLVEGRDLRALWGVRRKGDEYLGRREPILGC